MASSNPSSDAPKDSIILDGRTLEGGGQLLRLALSLSALTSFPVKIHSIRGNRFGGGGLKAQHLACVEWLAQACGARVEGAVKGSKEVLFVPGGAGKGSGELSLVFSKRRIEEGKREVYEAKLEIKTAGSTGLALQAILPFVLFTSFPAALPVRLTLSGGTNVSQSPSYEYITQVLLPTLHTMGLPPIEAKLGKRGWSHGGSSIGTFTLEIPPRRSIPLPAFYVTPPTPPPAGRGEKDVLRPGMTVEHLSATFIAPSDCHDHFQASLKKSLKYHFPHSTYPSFTTAHGNLSVALEDSRHAKRMYFILVATVSHSSATSSSVSSSLAQAEANNTVMPSLKLARDWLYDRKLPQKVVGSSHDSAAEDMADTVAAGLVAEIESGACVDEHMRDQLVVFQALATGRSQVFGGDGREASLHAKTAEWVAAQLLGPKGVSFDGRGGSRGKGFDGADGCEGDGVVEGIEKLGLGECG